MRVRIIPSAVFFILLVGCATPMPDRFSSLKLGLDKAQVLDHMGAPKRTWRENDGDEWAYVYYRGDVAVEKILRFEKSLLVSISPEQKTLLVNKQQEDRITKDYEKLTRDIKPPPAKPKADEKP